MVRDAVDIAVDRGGSGTRVLVVGEDAVTETDADVPLDEVVRRATDRPIRRAAIAVPYDLMSSWQRAVQEELQGATGVRPAYLIQEPVAAAIAAGLHGRNAIGVVDVGCTDVRASVVFRNTVVAFETWPLYEVPRRMRYESINEAIELVVEGFPGGEVDGLRWAVVGGSANGGEVVLIRHTTRRSLELVPDPAHTVVRGVAAALANCGN